MTMAVIVERGFIHTTGTISVWPLRVVKPLLGLLSECKSFYHVTLIYESTQSVDLVVHIVSAEMILSPNSSFGRLRTSPASFVLPPTQVSVSMLVIIPPTTVEWKYRHAMKVSLISNGLQ
jgi:hypothetical protein